MILVTHYLEEIMPAFTHVFLLKSGRCAAKGEKEQILRRDLLTQAFGIPIEAAPTERPLLVRVQSLG